MRFACLGSGSEGNAMIVEAGATRVMVDCGFSLAETEARLERFEINPQSLNAIIVTHEHGDHVRGAARFAQRHGVPVWLTYGTLQASGAGWDDARLQEISAGRSFRVGELEVLPYCVPHDAREAVQFVLTDGRWRLGILTDTGSITPHIESTLSGCDALVLECNHDAQMLERGPYPPTLKQRVGGRQGHLSNAASADLLKRLDTRRLQHVVAAHLSKQNNTPELAAQSLAGALGCEPGAIAIASQDSGLSWRSMSAW